MSAADKHMDCSFCKKPAAVELRYTGHVFCKEHFTKLFWKRTRRTISNNDLIEPKDTLGLALSGGKDSVACLHVLHRLLRSRPDTKMIAITIDEGIAGYRANGVRVARKNCKELKVRHEVVSFKREFGRTLDQIVKIADRKKTGYSPCTFCGVLRRYLLNKAAKRFGCTKLVTAHNLDDEATTVLMNVMRGDVARLGRVGAKVGIDGWDGFVQRVKPFAGIPEKESALFGFLTGLDADYSTCPYAGRSFRGSVRETLNGMESRYPGVKFSIVEGAAKIAEAVKGNEKKTGGRPSRCPKCGETSARGPCQACKCLELVSEGNH